MSLTSAMATLKILVISSVRMTRSISVFRYRCDGRRWIIRGEMLYQASIDLVHNPNSLGDSMNFMMDASRSRAWLVLAIGGALLFRGLLVLGLDNKRLYRYSERATRRERRNGFAVDDTNVRGGSGGGDSGSANPTLAKACKVSPCVSHLSHPPTFHVYRPLRRFPAPRFLDH
ncbi:hypothetical protein Acr_26g0000280 [Actinidia rufa]|uniref:Uncharacterized protein n=1 Tax=Actinidia rufa TaxID=165716 RepID=A0A7J0H175_9ERIC|nr:hypothetical protein Acr_26g0000280 [Actinidia rufa]